jgi:hypothetical protein
MWYFQEMTGKMSGKDGETKSYRQKMLLDELLEMLGRLEPDIGCEDAGGASTGEGNHVDVVLYKIVGHFIQSLIIANCKN